VSSPSTAAEVSQLGSIQLDLYLLGGGVDLPVPTGRFLCVT
jgi:hypothetical protein